MSWRDVMGLSDLPPQPLSPQFPQYPQIPTEGSSEDFGDSGYRESTVEGEEAIREAIDERAATMEVDGGLPQDRAQEVAELAGLYYAHAWNCAACRAGTQVGAGLHRPCPEGALLWTAYAEAAADARGTKKSWSKQ